MKKQIALSLVFVAFAAAAVYAYTEARATRFNDVKVEDLKLDDGDIVDTSGTTRLTIGATNALTGNLTVSGTAAVANTVTVSSAATSTVSQCFVGAKTALPTTGFARGCMLFLTSDNKVYVATETVTATTSWQAIGAQ